MMRRHTLIINYLTMRVGGIEQYLYYLSKYIVNGGGRVIWLCDAQPVVADSFKDFMLSDQVERVTTKTRGLHWFKHDPIMFDKNEQIVMLSFSPYDMAKALTLRDEYRDYDIQCFYVVANFEGPSYFVEQNFKGFFKSFTYKRIRELLFNWEKTNHIRFFSLKHVEAYEKNYKFRIANRESKILKNVIPIEKFDTELAENRSKRKKFNVITIGRFDFPNKGYIIGLIKSYGKLKAIYPKLTLTVVGYGKCKKEVIKEIEDLPNQYKNDVTLIGEVSPEELKYYFQKVHLNIGVAGAIRSGARFGVPSIPARHNSYSCEVYGYLPESKSKTLSMDKGLNVEIFIEEVMNMEESSYIELCKKSYEAYKTEDVEPLYFFNTKNSNKKISLSKFDVGFIKTLSYIRKYKKKLNIIVQRLENSK